MRIDGTGRVISTNRQTSTAKSSGETFRAEGGQPQARASQTAHSAGMSGIDALLALQAAEDPTQGRRKAIKRANGLLDALEDIRGDLLVGRVSEGRLNRAAVLLQQAKGQELPGLDEVIADIELRVRVELAKLGRYLGL
ncbi:flagellar assembly protein FliX [Pelagibacterium luteolum]|uniref:Class II flagellar assembly regulator n=1 Tax=Pelagibacterium luteolum TaxID=440168 RepID=A0A1G7YA10_9HYPH|nr:flagellar assembly protein FliX [Pelagibacterium luteolum]SDG93302.1 Class II flagellar assembly regulator [Pelagibacterium luteolum]